MQRKLQVRCDCLTLVEEFQGQRLAVADLTKKNL